MRFLEKIPTWAVSTFTAVMGVCMWISLAGWSGYGADPFIFWAAFCWTILGSAELLRRTDWDTKGKDDDETPPAYWP